MRFVLAVVGVLFLVMLSGLTHSESWVNRVLPGQTQEVSFVHEQITDISWVLLLCTFSMLIRFRKRKTARAYLMALGFLLMALAALHSHPLWSAQKMKAPMELKRENAITRIVSVPSVLIESGLKLDDVVTSMAFDREGILWLSTPSNGPYYYSVSINEVENLLRPDVVYGFSPDPGGMWVFTTRGAFLYSGKEIVRAITFPQGIIPLCATEVDSGTMFGTTRGLFYARAGETTAQHEALQERVTHLRPWDNGILVTGDSGIWRWNSKGTAQFVQVRRLSICGLTGVGRHLYAATSDAGILALHPAPSKGIRFALPELNMISPGAVTTYRGMPCFGAYDGSIVCESPNGWRRWKTGDYPVTAIASDNDHLYVWSGGRLTELEM